VRVLAIGAHPDDCEIGAGATLAKHAAAGDEVRIYALSTGVGARKGDEFARLKSADVAWRALSMDTVTLSLRGLSVCLDAFQDQRFDEVPFINVVRAVETIASYAPDVVYTHHEGDLNLDHAITARAVKTAFRPKPGIKAPRILAFEVLSSTELGAPFIPNVFVDVDGEPMGKKLKALEAYGDEIPPAPHPRSLEAVRHLAGLRGASVGLRQAEAFQLIREVL
jgi:LmbE family N-acetylglucosaminyl deacetylase